MDIQVQIVTTPHTIVQWRLEHHLRNSVPSVVRQNIEKAIGAFRTKYGKEPTAVIVHPNNCTTMEARLLELKCSLPVLADFNISMSEFGIAFVAPTTVTVPKKKQGDVS